jgi:XTP/dITP diphosphohydrolase
MNRKKQSLAFITTNKHKFAEVQDILKPFGFKIEHLSLEYEENHDASMEQIAHQAATKLSGELQRPIILEDTGLFFDAYPNFPGALPKFVFNTLGYKGIMKLLAGEERGAYFKTVAAYAEPGNEPLLFEGTMRGTLTEDVFDADKDFMPYDRIFIPDGYTKTISGLSMTEKNSFSQRSVAFRKLGEYLQMRPPQ